MSSGNLATLSYQQVSRSDAVGWHDAASQSTERLTLSSGQVQMLCH